MRNRIPMLGKVVFATIVMVIMYLILLTLKYYGKL